MRNGREFFTRPDEYTSVVGYAYEFSRALERYWIPSRHEDCSYFPIFPKYGRRSHVVHTVVHISGAACGEWRRRVVKKSGRRGFPGANFELRRKRVSRAKSRVTRRENGTGMKEFVEMKGTREFKLQLQGRFLWVKCVKIGIYTLVTIRMYIHCESKFIWDSWSWRRFFI